LAGSRPNTQDRRNFSMLCCVSKVMRITKSVAKFTIAPLVESNRNYTTALDQDCSMSQLPICAFFCQAFSKLKISLSPLAGFVNFKLCHWSVRRCHKNLKRCLLVRQIFESLRDPLFLTPDPGRLRHLTSPTT